MNGLPILTVGAFVQGTELFVIAGLLPRIASDFGVGLPAAGQLVTVFAVVYAVAAPLLAAITESIPRRRLLAVSMLAFAFANLGAALAPGYAWMLVARVVAALAACLYFPSALALAAQMAPEGRRGRSLAMVLLGLNLATLLGVPAGIWIGSLAGWRAVFLVLGALSLAVATGVRIALPEVPALPGAPLPRRIAVLRNPGIPSALGLTVTTLVSVFSVYTYLAAILRTEAGLSVDSLARLLFFFGVSSALGAWIGGIAADRARTKPLLALCVVVLALVLAGFSTVATSFGAAAGLLTVWGLFGGAFNPLQQQRLMGLADGHPSTTLAWNSSAVYLGQAMAGALGGFVLHLRGAGAIGAVGAVTLLSGLILLAGPRALLFGTRRRAALATRAIVSRR